MHDILEVSEIIKFAFCKDDKLVTVHLSFLYVPAAGLRTEFSAFKEEIKDPLIADTESGFL